MYVYLLGFLFVFLIPLIQGVLIALVLREVHIRHPIPLGGALVPQWWLPPKVHEPPGEVAEAETEAEADSEEEKAENDEQKAAEPPAGDPDGQAETPPTEISVFDEATANVPQNLQVNDVLNAMISESSVEDLDDFESIIEATAQSKTAILEEIETNTNDMNLDDLQALAEALPGTKIDFSTELDADSYASNPMDPTVEELLGENFDYDALGKQTPQDEQDKQTPQPLTFLAPADADEVDEDADADEDEDDEASVADAAEFMLDVQEDESGTVQVSSPFIVNTTPKFADFAVPQTILSSFSGDWIQEASGMAESSDGDPEKFCFTEESRPMFVRKRRKPG